MQAPTVYNDLYVIRSDNNIIKRHALHNKTVFDAYLEAECLGFKPSPWWRFWSKNYVVIEGYVTDKGRGDEWYDTCEYIFYSANKFVRTW